MSNPKVSVVMPVYNAKHYLVETIESVLNQTYHNFELLVIDDSSTDSSLEILREYEIKDSRVKVFHTMKNSGGPAEPRNIGIDHASGAYIAFIDSDDVWFPQKIEIQINRFLKEEINFLCTEIKTFTGECNFNEVLIEKLGVKKITLADLLKKNEIPLSTVMVDKQFLGGLRFKVDPCYIAVEDYELWLRLHDIEEIKSLKLRSKLVFYRDRNDSLSQNKLMMAKKVFNLLRNLPLRKKLGFKVYYYFVNYLMKSAKKCFN